MALVGQGLVAQASVSMLTGGGGAGDGTGHVVQSRPSLQLPPAGTQANLQEAMRIINDGQKYFVGAGRQEGSQSPSKARPYGQSPSVQGVAFAGPQKPVLAGVQSGILTKTQSRILFANNQPNPKSSVRQPAGGSLAPGHGDSTHYHVQKKRSTCSVGPHPLHLADKSAKASVRHLKVAANPSARLISVR